VEYPDFGPKDHSSLHVQNWSGGLVFYNIIGFYYRFVFGGFEVWKNFSGEWWLEYLIALEIGPLVFLVLDGVMMARSMREWLGF